MRTDEFYKARVSAFLFFPFSSFNAGYAEEQASSLLLSHFMSLPVRTTIMRGSSPSLFVSSFEVFLKIERSGAGHFPFFHACCLLEKSFFSSFFFLCV